MIGKGHLYFPTLWASHVPHSKGAQQDQEREVQAAFNAGFERTSEVGLSGLVQHCRNRRETHP